MGYELGDLVGREGIERAFEEDLRGADGYEQVVVDAKGRRQHDAFVTSLLGDQRRFEPKPGKNVYLSVDLDLQLAAEAAFKKQGVAGSVVAIDPNTGSVLTMVSAPEFDPNAASGALGASEKAALDKDPLRPWLNRPIQGQFVPGSTFKVATALAALMSNTATPSEHVHCPGQYRMGHYTWRCHGTHGSVDLKRALQVSCDTYFYTMAGRMGLEPIAKASRMLGLGSVSGIALRGERSGLIPDEAYHNRADKASGGYQKGMAINAAIGQGSVLVTPLQLAYAYAAIANDGTVYGPRMVERIESADLRVKRRTLQAYGAIREDVQGDAPSLMRELVSVVRSKVELPKDYLAPIREGLIAVAEPGGTGYRNRSQKVTMAGKSGTAQVVRIGAVRLKMEQMDYFHRDHGWFVGWAPAEKPEIVVAVLNEHSGHGGVTAEPVVTEVIDTFYRLAEKRALRDMSLTSGNPVPWVPPPAPKRATAAATTEAHE
ncbi:MAG TPA: penicillin-binding transpeptidase domain-containing protein, partial [Myxococcota bacterium]|nr:penicillin-binding transpeptidase domain-containing protein [Myxococcota bacterium]